MLSQFVTFYPWLKALHVACVILWAGPQLVLALLIYALRDMNGSQHASFVGRMGFLINSLMNAAMFGAFLLGGLMLSVIWQSLEAPPMWLWLKIGFVFALSTLHGLLFRQFRRAMRGQTIWSWRRYDLVQSLSVATTVVIVMLVIIKPMGHG